MSFRTHTLGELRIENVGEKVTVSGFVKRIRNFGEIIFADLRDHYGITQIVVDKNDLKEKINNIYTESTISVTGTVLERKDKNPKLETGDIEVLAEEITIFSVAKSNLPFEINEDYKNNKEDLRLQYRYLDLRNEEIHNNIVLRSKIMKDVRNYMDENEFIEVQTPIFANSSPEGARDYLIASRLHKGEFYALPQAPQQFKQLLMVSGFDKYYQIAPCFRDEDPRADRSPCEFYQIDFEMSFAEENDVHEVLEGIARDVFTKNTDYTISEKPFEKIKYSVAMDTYGSDKPDLRNPLTLKNVTDLFENTDIKIFENKKVYMCVAPGVKGRKYYDGLTDYLKTEKDASGLAWMKIENGERSGGVTKLISDDMYQNLIKKEQERTIENIDFNNYSMFLVADENIKKAQDIAGSLRIKLGEDFELIEKDVFKFCFIVDFPFYEMDKEGNIDFSHNPFSKPKCTLEELHTVDPYSIVANQYDLVCNGYEIASGAARNYEINMMKAVFEKVGYTEKEVEDKFKALYTAFQYGVPPHSGAALGLDRIVMLLAKTTNIREVIAFPKNKKARDLMVGAPSFIPNEQLKELSIKVIED